MKQGAVSGGINLIPSEKYSHWKFYIQTSCKHQISTFFNDMLPLSGNNIDVSHKITFAFIVSIFKSAAPLQVYGGKNL